MVVEGVAACVVHALQTAAVPAVVGEARRIEHGDGEPAVVDIRAVLRDEPGGAPGEITLGGLCTVASFFTEQIITSSYSEAEIFWS